MVKGTMVLGKEIVPNFMGELVQVRRNKTASIEARWTEKRKDFIEKKNVPLLRKDYVAQSRKGASTVEQRENKLRGGGGGGVGGCSKKSNVHHNKINPCLP